MIAPTMLTDDIELRVMSLIETFGKGVGDATGELRVAGFSSLDVVNLMLEVEEAFDLQVPAALMTPANFRSAQAIAALVRSLEAG